MTEPACGAPRPEDDAERRQVLALVARAVRLRFALDAVRFADRLLELARAAGPDPARSLSERVERLSLDDLYLATACAGGDEAAWEELGSRYFGFIRGFARRFLPDQDAADLADQVIADLWQRRKLGRYEGRSTLRTWLGAVTAHAALNAGKLPRRTVPLAAMDVERPTGTALSKQPAPTTFEAGSALLRQIVAEAIRGLAAEEKLLLQLYYEQGLTLDEMAVALRASKAALSRRLKGTREALRASIESRARQTAGVSADALRSGLDLGRLEIDLEALLGRGLEGRRGGAV